ncbi:type VII secretion-associated serine protease mycosin [Streptomyces sp. PG2]|uniref:type VII secretion-associated serine protease mycosin n=1 Tax=Streptomyces griseoaurantiacus TaxID=68213 RepID=UPI00352C1047
MPSSKRRSHFWSSTSALLGLALVGISASPAYAESIRSQQWHLDAMHVAEMWKSSTGSGVTIALIDSGVDKTLADLDGQVLKGQDYSSQRGDEHTDIAGHGTSMAALIAATGARGAVNGSYGLAPGAKILPIRMRYSTEDPGQVDAGSEFSRVISKAIRYAADSDAKIINLSLGANNAPGRNNVGTPQLAAAVRYALDRGKLLFAAVGNAGHGSSATEYPAATPGVVGVGAADENAKVAPFSQTGSTVDLVAPGVNMVHACPGKTEICKSRGTSEATAIASASAALIWSKHPDWTNNQVLRVMLNTASKPSGGEKHSDYVGYGGVRPRVALTRPGDPGPADEYPLPDLAAASRSASPETPWSSESDTAGAVEDDPEVAGTKTGQTKRTSLWVGLGIAAAALVGAAVAVPVLRTRRRTTRTPSAAAPPVPPMYPPFPPQSPHQLYPHQGQPHQPSVPQAPYQQPPGGPGSAV